MKLWKSIKAISSIIAVVILIAITISGGLLVFAIMNSTLTGSNQKVQVNFESLSLYRSTGEPKVVFTATLKNTGNRPIKQLTLKVHNESDYTVPSVSAQNHLEPGRTVGVALTPPQITAEWYVVGNAYSVTVRAEAVDGSTFSTVTSVMCFGTGQAAGHSGPPPFERVASLQTSDFAEALVVDGNYLYAWLYTDPAVVVKVDLSSFTIVKSLELSSGSYILSMVASGGKLYVGFEPQTCNIIVKIDLSTFSEKDTLILKDDEYYIYSLAVSADGSFLYAGTFLEKSNIVKVDLTTFSRVGALTLPPGESYVDSLMTSGNYLYAGLNVDPGKIAKIDLQSFTEVACLTFDAGESYTMGMVASDGYLYAALDSSPAKVVKVDLSTFKKEATLTLNSDEKEAEGVAVSGNYLYAAIASAGQGNSLGEVVRMDMSTFTRMAGVALSGKVTWTPNGIIASRSYLYVVFYNDPLALKGIDKIKIASTP